MLSKSHFNGFPHQLLFRNTDVNHLQIFKVIIFKKVVMASKLQAVK